MFCRKCGKQILEEEKFCSACGSPVGESKQQIAKHDNVKKINVCMMVVAVAMFLLMMLSLFDFIPSIKDFRVDDNNSKEIAERESDLLKLNEEHIDESKHDPIEEVEEIHVEGHGFESPEETVKAYIEALNNGDIDGMIATFAIESYVDNFDTRAHIEGYAAFTPKAPFSATYELSDGSDFDRNIRIKARQAAILSKYYNMLSQQTVHHNWMTIGPLEGKDVDDFMNKMRESDFLNDWKNMKFVEIIAPDEICDKYYSEQNQKNIKIQTKSYCCEDIEDVCALVEIAGEKYYQFAQCGMYGGRWYIITCSGNLASLVGVSTDLYGLVPCADVEAM